jgi:hypothetical protein
MLKWIGHNNGPTCNPEKFLIVQIKERARSQWIMPVILATQETEIKRITVQSQPSQIVLRDPILEKPFTKKVLVEWLKV